MKSLTPASFGIDGNAAYVLVGEDLATGEACFVEIPQWSEQGRSVNAASIFSVIESLAEAAKRLEKSLGRAPEGSGEGNAGEGQTDGSAGSAASLARPGVTG